jgi:hypothetical protein
MADLVTVPGGSKHGITGLTPVEHQIALKALAKLSGVSGSATSGVASVFGGSLRSATLSGGSVHTQNIDKLPGGVKSAPGFGSIGSDTVVAGSAFTAKDGVSSATGVKSGALGLGGDTISVAGATAASVKHEPVQDAKAVHTITMSDKTTITLTGVAPHDVPKSH